MPPIDFRKQTARIGAESVNRKLVLRLFSRLPFDEFTFKDLFQLRRNTEKGNNNTTCIMFQKQTLFNDLTFHNLLQFSVRNSDNINSYTTRNIEFSLHWRQKPVQNLNNYRKYFVQNSKWWKTIYWSNAALRQKFSKIEQECAANFKIT